jgi:multidrug resistance efflux pump
MERRNKMTDGNTYAINKRLEDQEDYDAMQEVTADLEQAETRIEELEAKLAKASAERDEALNQLDSARHALDVVITPAELKGQDDA